jgi:predicted dinucleotide-binding enzyme
VKEALAGAEVVFLATPFQANEAALKSVEEELKGKILVDCTNPIGPNLTHGLNSRQSGSEMVQQLVPETKVVKACFAYRRKTLLNALKHSELLLF